MIAALAFIAYCYALWWLFIGVMAAKAIWHELPLVTRILLAPGALLAVLMDVGLNMAATIPFAEIPDEWTLSKRLGRYIREGGWRRGPARIICRYLLDPFQLGGHCR